MQPLQPHFFVSTSNTTRNTVKVGRSNTFQNRIPDVPVRATWIFLKIPPVRRRYFWIKQGNEEGRERVKDRGRERNMKYQSRRDQVVIQEEIESFFQRQRLLTATPYNSGWFWVMWPIDDPFHLLLKCKHQTKHHRVLSFRLIATGPNVVERFIGNWSIRRYSAVCLCVMEERLAWSIF